MKTHVPKTALLGFSLLFSTVSLSAQILASGLCNTGLIPKAPQPTGCTTSIPVTPVNPVDGGTSVDGNWQLARPYPSAPYTAAAPDPCTSRAYGPAWVNAAFPGWYNPDDQISQWIEPLGGGYTSPGWYIYRTSFPVPLNDMGYLRYALEVNGQFMGDNEIYSIYLEDPIGDTTSCRAVDVFSSINQQYAWNSFTVRAAALFPGTNAFLYFVVYNQQGAVGGNPTGLRVEFITPEFLPY